MASTKSPRILADLTIQSQKFRAYGALKGAYGAAEGGGGHSLKSRVLLKRLDGYLPSLSHKD